MPDRKYRIFMVLLSAVLVILLTLLVTSNPGKAAADVDSSMVGYVSTEAERSSLDLTATRTSETEVTETSETAPETETQEASAEPAESTETPVTETASETPAPETAASETTAPQILDGVTILVGDSRAYTFEFFGLYPEELVYWFMDQVDLHYSEIEQAASLHPAKIVFLNGVDDLGAHGSAQVALSVYEAYISHFESLSPDTIIYVHSVLPVTEKACQRFPGLYELDTYNTLLVDMCARHGWTFVNCAENFDLSYLDTDGIHFFREWAEIWIAQMRAGIGF